MTLYVRSDGIYLPVNFDNLTRREGGVYAKYNELLVRESGTYKSVWRSNGPPPAPIGLTTSAVNGGKVNVSWSYASNPENDYLRVEVQQFGDTARLSTNY